MTDKYVPVYRIREDERAIKAIRTDSAVYRAGGNCDAINPYVEENQDLWFAIILDGMLAERVNGAFVISVIYKE